MNNADILIFQSENVYIQKIENRLEGEFNKVHWHDAYSTQSGHPFHGKVDSWSVATRGV